MTFVYFVPDLISWTQLLAGAVLQWLVEARDAAGDKFGLILLLTMSAAVPAAVWLVIYRMLITWLRAGRDTETRRR